MAKHCLHFNLFTFSEILNLLLDGQIISTSKFSLFQFSLCSIKINVYMLKFFQQAQLFLYFQSFILKAFKVSAVSLNFLLHRSHVEMEQY